MKLRQKEVIISEDVIESRREIDGFVQKDGEGMLICGEHKVRRYGWRSLPPVVLTSPEGEKVETNRADYRLAARTPTEIEAHWLESEGILVG
jgi:hypothetical protein